MKALLSRLDRLGLAFLAATLIAAILTPALAWTEALTERAAEGASDENYAALSQSFSELEALFLTVAIGAINQWSRIAGALRFAPPIPRVSESAT